MRLKHIQTSGFKSFVDPLKINFDSNLTGVVGPNGCGKSNVVDAIKWVLGESSAKQVRGDTMTDVIFNGTETRKRMSFCSVEMVFDNTHNKIQGMWGRYDEISIKRTLNRDSESNYFINNQNVRKRDVTDIFYGTGLGPRGYSIIEQGTIGRLVDARPEELKIYIEEAAGVSKYKERKKETESRLNNSKDNLKRVQDLDGELTNRLELLKEQAEKANQFKSINNELSLLKTKYYLCLIENNKEQLNKLKTSLDAQKLEKEKIKSNLVTIETKLDELKVNENELSNDLRLIQTSLYEKNSLIMNEEKNYEINKNKKESLEKEILTLTQKIEYDTKKITEITQLISNSNDQRSNLINELDILNNKLENKITSFSNLKEEYNKKEHAKEEIRSKILVSEKNLSMLINSKENVSNNITETDHKINELNQLVNEYSDDKFQVEIDNLENIVSTKNSKILEINQTIDQNKKNLFELKQDHEKVKKNIENNLIELNKAKSSKSVLTSFNKDKLDEFNLENWDQKNLVELSKKVFQYIDIQDGWEKCVQSALGEKINYYILKKNISDDDFYNIKPVKGFFSRLTSFNDTSDVSNVINLITSDNNDLLSQLTYWLKSFYYVESASEVKNKLNNLPENSKIVTKDGHIYDENSIKFYSGESVFGNVLVRNTEIKKLTKNIEKFEAELNIENKKNNSLISEIELLEKLISSNESKIKDYVDENHENKIQLAKLLQDYENLKKAADTNNILKRELEQKSANNKISLNNFNREIDQENENLNQNKAKFQDLNEDLSSSKGELDSFQDDINALKFKKHELELNISNLMSKVEESNKELDLTSESITTNKKNSDNSSVLLQDINLKSTLEIIANYQQEKVDIEKKLSDIQDKLNGYLDQISQLNSDRNEIQGKLNPFETKINSIMEKITELDISLKTNLNLLEQLNSDVDIENHDFDLSKGLNFYKNESSIFSRKVEEFGPVNMAAEEEIELLNERKKFINNQVADLINAIETLQDSIKKIDNDTIELINTTFNSINSKLKPIFSKLFGGGYAELFFTSKDLLESGIELKAQLPGKKLQHLKLLSGGEKALTALSLVFAFFEHSPSPFCVLDEVDAPLDDNNTIRLGKRLKEESSNTQFIFITHNKITMEVAEQLVGITMGEPGVSKAVNVNIAETISSFANS
ncbi:MAG: chromosome segregation protein SMC [Hydrogenophilales bacterium]